jgi:hypothetical protein
LSLILQSNEHVLVSCSRRNVLQLHFQQMRSLMSWERFRSVLEILWFFFLLLYSVLLGTNGPVVDTATLTQQKYARLNLLAFAMAQLTPAHDQLKLNHGRS